MASQHSLQIIHVDYNLLEQEIIRISWGWSNHDDYRHQPVLKKTSPRGVERSVTREEAGEWQDTFPSKRLDNFEANQYTQLSCKKPGSGIHTSSLGKQHSHHSAKGRHGNENRHDPFCLFPEEYAEE